MIQSNYFPWRGYFDFVDSVDLFVLYDDVPYGTGRKWRNRNMIRTATGTRWLSVPLQRSGIGNRPVTNVQICHVEDWTKRHRRLLHEHYRNAPYLDHYADEVGDLLARPFDSLSELNEAAIRWVAQKLGIETRIAPIAPLGFPPGPKETRPLEVLTSLGATSYLTGPNTLPYVAVEAFRKHGITLHVKAYDYAPYRQCWPGFVEGVSVLDLLFNTGPEARSLLKSRTPDRVL